MHSLARVLAVLALLSFASNVISTSIRQSRLPRAPSLSQQLNHTTLSILEPINLSAPSPTDPWVYKGARGLYSLSAYTEPSIGLVYISNFFFTCLADLFNAITHQNFRPHQAYPDGRYQCQYTYAFPQGPIAFKLELIKVDAPQWVFSFSDLGDDLSALFIALQHFAYGIPQMNIAVYRYINGHGGAKFLASHGILELWHMGANVSVA